MDRKAGASAPKSRSRTKKATKPSVQSRGPAPRPAPGVWLRGLRAGLAASGLALVAAFAVSIMAGHAPSWRSLQVVCLQALPLTPGIAVLWWLLEVLKARLPFLPLAFWLAVAFVGTLAVMLLAPGIVFAIHSRSVAFAEDYDGDMNVLHHLIGSAAALYLYATTAFRLWWPWGAAIPALVAVLFWRSNRTRG